MNTATVCRLFPEVPPAPPPQREPEVRADVEVAFAEAERTGKVQHVRGWRRRQKPQFLLLQGGVT